MKLDLQGASICLSGHKRDVCSSGSYFPLWSREIGKKGVSSEGNYLYIHNTLFNLFVDAGASL